MKNLERQSWVTGESLQTKRDSPVLGPDIRKFLRSRISNKLDFTPTGACIFINCSILL